MLARVAADFYWLGRYVERVEQTARLLEYQLTRLVDRPADELAVGWGAIYRALGQAPPGATSGVEEAEDFLIPDAYTLAGNLVEESANPDSILSCWRLGRENAQRVRAQLPLSIWTGLNQGYLWMREVDFAREWAQAPAQSRARSSTACVCSQAWCTRRCRATTPGVFSNSAASSSGRSTRPRSWGPGSSSRAQDGASPRFRGRICFTYAVHMKSTAAVTR